eukprot:TRINITY_DN4495_c0_g3_i5.p1 TRINITY_DN4495_c0_g3~~TRINITY_DN4495_c0_g3_i5.p1  ORF type:complete len:149 (-),score=8.90 TRINITY_DN4495_c0_g3_i5:22-468(-)
MLPGVTFTNAAVWVPFTLNDLKILEISSVNPLFPRILITKAILGLNLFRASVSLLNRYEFLATLFDLTAFLSFFLLFKINCSGGMNLILLGACCRSLCFSLSLSFRTCLLFLSSTSKFTLRLKRFSVFVSKTTGWSLTFPVLCVDTTA